MKYLYYLQLLCTMLLMCAACSSGDENDNPAPPVTDGDDPADVVENIDMTIVAEMSRTHLDNEGVSVEWEDTGEYIMVYQTVNGSSCSHAKSSEGVVSDGKATFGVSFQRVATATNFTYNAIYPADVVTSTSNNPASVSVSLPYEQRATASSFDGTSDILVSRTIESPTQPTTLSMAFKRLTAIGKLSMVELGVETIDRVDIRFEGKRVAGEAEVNLKDYTIVATAEAVDNVSIEFSSAVAATTPIYFSVLPFEMSAGDTFHITVYSGTTTISREVTLSADRSLNFVEGEISLFKVNMRDDTGSSDGGNEGGDDTMSAIAGEWHLVEWCGTTNYPFDIYLDITSNGEVTLLQRLGEHGWKQYISTATMDNGIISGLYSDGTAWAASYTCQMVDANRMMWTNRADAGDISIYERTTIPDSIVPSAQAFGTKHSIRRYL